MPSMNLVLNVVPVAAIVEIDQWVLKQVETKNKILVQSRIKHFYTFSLFGAICLDQKWNATSFITIEGMYELPHESPHDIRLKILQN